MISALSERLSKQSLEDVSFPFQIQYQTRSKTRAAQQSIDNGLSPGNRISDDAPSLTADGTCHGERPRSKSHTSSTFAGCATSRDGAAPGTVDHGAAGRPEDPLSFAPPAAAAAPPKKRHCRSMSAGEVTEGRGAGGGMGAGSVHWKPRASKLWRPPPSATHGAAGSKQDGRPGKSALLSKAACFNYPRLSSHIPPGGKNGGAGVSEYSTPPDSPVPARSVSATASCEGGFSAPFWLERFNSSFRPVTSARYSRLSSLDDRDRMSESSGSVTSVSSSRSDSRHDMELRNQKVVQRCRSQPSVPVSRRATKRRRREEGVRPKLDFLKMEEVRLKWEELAVKDAARGEAGVNSRRTRSQAMMCKKSSLRSSCRKGDPEEFLGLQTIASSPGETNSNGGLAYQELRPVSPERESNTSSSIMITPTGSPTRNPDSKDAAGNGRHRNVSKDDGYHGDSDWEEEVREGLKDSEDEELFLGLDLDEIENH